MITKGFILAKDNYRISARIILENRSLRYHRGQTGTESRPATEKAQIGRVTP